MEVDQLPSHKIWIPNFDNNSEAGLLNEEELNRNFELINADIEILRRIFSSITSSGQASRKYSSPDWTVTEPTTGPYGTLVSELSSEERLLLLITILPHYAPEVMQEMVSPFQRGVIVDHPFLGGHINHATLQFIPNLQTILFLLAGRNKTAQHMCYRKLMISGTLLRRQLVSLNPPSITEPIRSERELVPELAEEYVQFVLQGRQPRPDFGRNFPAKLHTTHKQWDQLILCKPTERAVEILVDWIDHGSVLSDESCEFFGPGYPALFYGPPGTGKSLTAALIGKRCNVNVFRVDASRIVSKYIGETEKNIVQLFGRMKVENSRHEKKPILFFDEADVLFSKRTEVKDAKDKWANLETSVLLPLIEEYDGLVIVATNLEHNLDPAMDRRFQLKIKFPFPSYEERFKIWQKSIPRAFHYPSAIASAQLARYKLSQASIVNILKGSCLLARKAGSEILQARDLDYYIRLEFAKSGITPSWENIHSGTNLS